MIDIDSILARDRLPSLPHVAAGLAGFATPGEPDSGRFEWFARCDPATAVRILKFANSTYFGRKWPVGSVERAEPLLGSTVVQSLSLLLTFHPDALPGGAAEHEFYRYWKSSVTRATIAMILAADVQGHADSDAYFAGLLLDIGRLALLAENAREYCDVAEEARQTGVPVLWAERRHFGIDHAELGSRLLRRWGFPGSFAAAALGPEQTSTDVAASCGDPVIVAAVASRFVTEAIGAAELSNGVAGPNTLDALRDSFPALRFDVEQVIEQARPRVAAIEQRFPRQTAPDPSPVDIYTSVNAELAELIVCETIAATQAQARARLVREHLTHVEQRVYELEQKALRDPLTGLYNRQYLEEALTREAARCSRTAQPIGLLFVDVDHFKLVNDTWGHSFGDRALVQIARELQHAVRSSDTVARYGGEEFVVLPGQPTADGLAALAERIRETVASIELLCGGQRVPLTASVGYTLALPGRADTDLPARLIAASDAAMYEAKNQGRNRVWFESLMEAAQQDFMERLVERCFSRWLLQQGALSPAALAAVLTKYQCVRSTIGQLAIDHGLLTSEDVTRVVTRQRQQSQRFGDVAIELKLLTEDQLLWLLALQRENPVELARLAVGEGHFDDGSAVRLVNDYLRETGLPQPAQSWAGGASLPRIMEAIEGP